MNISGHDVNIFRRDVKISGHDVNIQSGLKLYRKPDFVYTVIEYGSKVPDTGRKRNMNKEFDVIIIGAGPGGIFCAYELMEKMPECRILMIEKGRSIEKRRCP